jgi:hypothetical protein
MRRGFLECGKSCSVQVRLGVDFFGDYSRMYLSRCQMGCMGVEIRTD